MELVIVGILMSVIFLSILALIPLLKGINCSQRNIDKLKDLHEEWNKLEAGRK
jgi:hypothetical protein